MCKDKKLYENFIRNTLAWCGVALLLFLICFFYYSEKNPNETVGERAAESAVEVEKIIVEKYI